jgi:uracil-DNA glycosylase
MRVRLADHWKSVNGWSALDAVLRGRWGSLDAFLSSQPRFYPDVDNIFNAFKATALGDVKVVILGQDPYPNDQATGLAFSVKDKKLTSSLRAIYGAIKHDYGKSPARTGDLSRWADDGVLLLNTALTVGDKPGSHRTLWDEFIEQTIGVIDTEAQSGVVFLLWGGRAWTKAKSVKNPRHYVLPAAHPAATNARLPLSRSRHFSITNHLLKANGHLLKANGRGPIDWCA